MATITPSLIHNRLGTVVSSPPATSNVGPTTGDIGADGTHPTAASLRRVFDIQGTSSNIGDEMTINIPAEMQKGIGLTFTVTPLNSLARTFNPVMVESATQLTLIAAGASGGGALFRITMDAMHSITR